MDIGKHVDKLPRILYDGILTIILDSVYELSSSLLFRQVVTEVKEHMDVRIVSSFDTIKYFKQWT